MRKKSKIHAIESGTIDRIPPPQNTRKARNSKEFRAMSVANPVDYDTRDALHPIEKSGCIFAPVIPQRTSH